jgi:low temperature requirement protein LtrA
VLAVYYLVFRFMRFVMFMIVARDDPGLRGQLFRFAPSVVAGSVVLLVASQFDGWVQTGLWMLAIVADYLGTRRWVDSLDGDCRLRATSPSGTA